MAFGQNIVGIAYPQPGTTNQPTPIKKVPAFFPVNFTVIDNYGAAVSAQTEVLISLLASLQLQIGNSATPGTLIACLSGINESLCAMADSRAAFSKTLNDLNFAIGSVTVSINQKVSILSMQVANKINDDNWHKKVNGANPQLPDIEEQIKIVVKDALILEKTAEVSGSLSTMIKNTTEKIAFWITGTDIYKSVSAWIKTATNSVFAPILQSVTSIKNLIKGGG